MAQRPTEGDEITGQHTWGRLAGGNLRADCQSARRLFAIARRIVSLCHLVFPDSDTDRAFRLSSDQRVIRIFELG